ncbi:hypothetical protein BJX64DRAFT_259626 [Aspergillus heterothallicus]
MTSTAPPERPVPAQIPVQMDDDWKGVLDAQRRRTLQNRLNQRARRKRLKAAKSGKGSAKLTKGSPATSADSAVDGIHPRSEQDDSFSLLSSLPTQNSIKSPSPRNSSELSPPLTASPSPPQPQPASQISFIELDRFKIIGPTAPNFRRDIGRLESFYRTEFAAGALRTELLLGLTRLNFLRALHANIDVLGYSAAEMHDDAWSPFGCAGAPKISYNDVDSLPPALRPTAIQLSVPHHPWLDLIPFPTLRDNLILLGDDLDDARLCHDMSGRGTPVVSEEKRLSDSAGETGVIVWRDPWDPSGWEVTESFLRRWAWTLTGCWDVFVAANRWRKVRGEPALVGTGSHHMDTRLTRGDDGGERR